MSGGGSVAAVVSGSWAPAGRLSPQLTWENAGATSLAPREGVGALGLIPRSDPCGGLSREGLTALLVFEQMDPVLVSEHFHLVAVPAGGPWPLSLGLWGWLLPTLPITSMLIPAVVGAEAVLGRPSSCSPGRRPSCLPQAVSGTCHVSVQARQLSYARSFSVHLAGFGV